MNAFSVPFSVSMRARQASTTSTGETSPARRRACNCVMLSYSIGRSLIDSLWNSVYYDASQARCHDLSVPPVARSMRDKEGIAAWRIIEHHHDHERSMRTVVCQSPGGLVENLQSANSIRGTWADGYSPEFQVCLPYAGLFVWHVGGEDVVADAN